VCSRASAAPVDLVLRVVGIASSTFYGWLEQAKRPSVCRLADRRPLAEIVGIHACSGGIYARAAGARDAAPPGRRGGR
jgi:hypothetical protein